MERFRLFATLRTKIWSLLESWDFSENASTSWDYKQLHAFSRLYDRGQRTYHPKSKIARRKIKHWGENPGKQISLVVLRLHPLITLTRSGMLWDLPAKAEEIQAQSLQCFTKVRNFIWNEVFSIVEYVLRPSNIGLIFGSCDFDRFSRRYPDCCFHNVWTILFCF